MSSPPSRRRLMPRRPGHWALLAGIVVVVLGVLAIGAWWAYARVQPHELTGSATEEFIASTSSTTATALAADQPWPTYGFDNQRTRYNPALRHRPPFTEEWLFRSRHLLEFPPVVADGRLFAGQLRGRFYAVDTTTGELIWKKLTGRCYAASPAYADGVVYAAFLAFEPCPKGQLDARGYVVAWNAADGKEIWRHDMSASESSPLVVNGLVYVGGWDGRVYALDAATGAEKWSRKTDAQVVSSASLVDGSQTATGRPAIVIGTNGGTLYQLDAATGSVNWTAKSNERLGRGREYFYATPTVAYGRVYVGNTDGWMYAYGAKTGKLLWAREAGSYVYTAAAAANQEIYIGTYDGYVLAYDAATGREKWRVSVPGAVHGAPTVMNGLLYFATCSHCGQNGVREAKRGPDGTYAIDLTTHEIVWRMKGGRYSPLVADDERVYLVGVGVIRGMRPTEG